jgi:helicase MOV-10
LYFAYPSLSQESRLNQKLSHSAGKTVTLVESILQLAKNTHSRILIVAPSNSAADLLATRLAKDGGKGLIHSKSLIRVNAMMRDPISVPKEVEPFCSRSLDGQRWELPDAPLLAKFKIVVTTCSSSFPLRAKHLKWDYIFVDEAAQASEPECMSFFHLDYLFNCATSC